MTNKIWYSTVGNISDCCFHSNEYIKYIKNIFVNGHGHGGRGRKENRNKKSRPDVWWSK